jgi:hypothetical protein
MGGKENDRFTGKVILLKKAIYHHWHGIPPDGIANVNGVVIAKIGEWRFE